MTEKVAQETSGETNRCRGKGRKVFWIAVAVGCATAVWVSAHGLGHGLRQASHRRAADHEELGKRLERALDALDVEDSQRARLSAVVARTQARLSQLQAERQELSERLAATLEAETLDAEALDRLGAEASALASQAVGEGVGALGQVSQLLKLEQRRQLVQRWRARR